MGKFAGFTKTLVPKVWAIRENGGIQEGTIVEPEGSTLKEKNENAHTEGDDWKVRFTDEEVFPVEASKVFSAKQSHVKPCTITLYTGDSEPEEWEDVKAELKEQLNSPGMPDLTLISKFISHGGSFSELARRRRLLQDPNVPRFSEDRYAQLLRRLNVPRY